METRIDTLLAQVYEIEGLMLVMQHRHSEMPPMLLAQLKAKLDTLKQQVADIEKELADNNPVKNEAPVPPVVVETPPIVEPAPEPIPIPEPKPKPAPEPKPEPAAVQKPEHKRNILQAFSINDRFFFQRELFDGNEQAFNDTIAQINQMRDMNQVSDFLTQEMLFDPSREEVKEFFRLIGLSFT